MHQRKGAGNFRSAGVTQLNPNTVSISPPIAPPVLEQSQAVQAKSVFKDSAIDEKPRRKKFTRL